MTKQSNRELWGKEDSLSDIEYEDYLSKVAKSNNIGNAYKIYLEGDRQREPYR